MGKEKDTLSTQEVLKLLNISRTSLYNLMKRGVIKPIQRKSVLKRPRLEFRRADVERLLGRENG